MDYLEQNIDKDLAHGVFFGVAIGDALGGALEFMTATEIKESHGEVRDMLGGGWLDLKIGDITDDTEMTIHVAIGILENPNNPIPAVGEQFKKWLISKPKDIGLTCEVAIDSAVIKEFTTKEEWFNVSEEYHTLSGGETAGNGALMRISYCSLYYEPEEAIIKAVDLGRMTHWHEHSNIAITCYTKAVTKLIRMPQSVDIPTRKKIFKDEMKDILNIGLLQGKSENPPPTGYVIDTLLCAINSIMCTDNFEDALIKAVNLGGDSDTIGAITGSLAGAIYGKSAIPKRWLSTLNVDTTNRLNYLLDLLKSIVKYA